MIDRALREGLIAVAHAAGDAILGIYESDFAVTHKHDDSPLTAADLAAHRCIVEGLARLTPEVPVLSEESSAQDIAQRRGWRRLWMVDPLDGTREFVKRNGEFSVNIALVEEGVAVYGVVQSPVSRVLWHGGAGVGAFRREGRTDTPIKVRCQASAPRQVATSRSHRDDRSEAFIERMGEVRPMSLGSSLKFCALADGRLDIYPRFGPTSEWDTAAGQCVLEGAGGAVVDLRGRALRYNQRDTLLNGDFIALGDPAQPWREWLGEGQGA